MNAFILYRGVNYAFVMRRMMRWAVIQMLGCGLLCAQPGPLQRQKVDPVAAARGRAVWAQYCINCHGALAKGTSNGPDLIRSDVVLRDRLGDEIGPALKRLPGHDTGITQAQLIDLTHFLKEQIEATAKDRNPVVEPNVLTGDAAAGRAYFEGEGGCAKCHSATGDLAGIASRYADPLDLEQRFLFPRRTKRVEATVTPGLGAAVRGEVLSIDDFEIAVRDAEGGYHEWTRGPGVRVEIHDPLAAHHELLDRYTDKEIHDTVRYLESLK